MLVVSVINFISMKERLKLPDVTVVAITTRDYGETIAAIKKTLDQIDPSRTIFFSDIIYAGENYDCIPVPKMDWLQYNEFVIKEMWRYIHTSHILLIQHDGYVLDASAWSNEFLQYDYIGAPWGYKDGRNVGNGGFSLRSYKLHSALAQDKWVNHNEVYAPEDEVICRLYRKYLEQTYQIKFAPEHIADKFSFEMRKPMQKTFGFHNHFHKPYREPVIIRRMCMGDMIMAEPLMEHLHLAGYRIILDTLPGTYDLFGNHFFPVEFLPFVKQTEDTSAYRVINLEMAYEVEPKELVLRSYFKAAGINQYQLRNPQLNHKPQKEHRIFDKYVVVHIDDTNIPHRNVHGINWNEVSYALAQRGYDVVQIGKADLHKMPVKINTPTTQMLAYVIGGADYFIGIDSGPSHIAVACGVESIIFFGSVDPALRHYDMTNVHEMQKGCDTPNCYHEVVSTVGQPCKYDEKSPPCITWGTKSFILELNSIIK